MLLSENRLLKDIERWQAAGWITQPGAAAIRTELEQRRSHIGLAHVLATLAAVLIGFGVMSFVAANWQEMSKLLRLAVIFFALWGAFAGAAALQRKGHEGFASALVLTGVAIFGAGIMLIAQMYHMDGHPPDAVLLWGIGGVATGLLTRSNPALAASLGLFVLWNAMEMGFGGPSTPINWGFLPAWAAVAAGYAMTRWRPGLHLLALAICYFIVNSAYLAGGYDKVQGHLTVTLIGSALVAVSMLFGEAIDRWRQISGAMLFYGFIMAFCGAFALQFVVDRPGAYTLFYGIIVLAAIVGVLVWAWRTDNRAVLWLAYLGFSIEIFSIYLKKVGTLLGTSGFFLATGLVFSALAYAAYRLHDQTTARKGAAS